MPGPDPHSLWIDHDGKKYTVTFENYFWTGNVGNRKARAEAILRRLMRNDWRCGWCGDDLPEWRRSDARYCSESCRKGAARWRRWKRIVNS